MEGGFGDSFVGPVIVVEDDYALASELSQKLTEAGIEVVGRAPTVGRALHLINGFPQIRAAILDINLAGEMVFTVADKLSNRGIPFFFTTGYSRDVVPPRFADRIFIEKPLDFGAVHRALFDCRAPPRQVTSQQNLILSALSSREMGFIKPHLEVVALEQGAVLEKQFSEIAAVYFVESGIVSLIAEASDGSQVEVGLIGREGLTGSGSLDGDLQTPYHLIVQIEGSAQRLNIDSFLRSAHRAPQLRSHASAFSRSLGVQTSYTALANSKIKQRLARWLLMLSDRMASPVLVITHEYIAITLGVRSPGVTDALHVLEGEKLIRSVRGKVIVVDRVGLLSKAGGSYGIPEAEYERLMGFQ